MIFQDFLQYMLDLINQNKNEVGDKMFRVMETLQEKVEEAIDIAAHNGEKAQEIFADAIDYFRREQHDMEMDVHPTIVDALLARFEMGDFNDDYEVAQAALIVH